MNNPIVIFKCDSAFIKEKLFLFGDSPINASKSSVPREETCRDEFIKLMQSPEPLLSHHTVKGENEIKAADGTQYDAVFSQQTDEYTDTLTTWLCDLMNSLHKNVEFELFEVEHLGVCIRYSPQEHANVYSTSTHDLRMLDKSLQDIVVIAFQIRCIN